MSDDPYSVLGLKKSVNRDQVRVAFRKLSKLYHPDVGGDPRQFSALKAAHDLLVDADRRAHWDKSGWDRGNEEQLNGQALGVLAGCLQGVLGGTDEPKLIDVVIRMKTMIQDAMNQQQKAVGQYQMILVRIDSMKGRFKCKKGGASALASLLEGQRAMLVASIQNIERQILVSEHAMKMLKDETFDSEKLQRVTMQQYGSGTSAYTMGFR